MLVIIHKTQVKKTFSSELLLFYVRRGTVHSDVCGLGRQTRTEGGRCCEHREHNSIIIHCAAVKAKEISKPWLTKPKLRKNFA